MKKLLYTFVIFLMFIEFGFAAMPVNPAYVSTTGSGAAWSSAMTSTHITDLAAGESVVFKLNRDSGVASDYEQLVGAAYIELKYKRTHDATF